MSERKHIDDILASWPYDPGAVTVRKINGADGRDLLQMRVEMGLLQLEVTGRPDGSRPGEKSTFFDHLVERQQQEGEAFALSDDDCIEIDREFVQFYHRRVCWLSLYDYHLAVGDADHTLKLMDFCKEYSPEESWTLSHEQYRPFVLFHRTQAAALAELKESDTEKEPAEEDLEGAEAAMQAIDAGLEQMKIVFQQYEAEDQYEEDELVVRLIDLREQLRERYEVGQTLQEKLADAVATEQYELAAKLRDEMAERKPGTL